MTVPHKITKNSLNDITKKNYLIKNLRGFSIFECITLRINTGRLSNEFIFEAKAMLRINKAILMASALFLVLTTAQPGLPGRDRQAEADPNYLIQTTLLLNRSVRFVEEGRTGEINRLYMDPISGLIPFCMLSFHAFFGIVKKNCLLSIPWSHVRFDHKNKQFVIRKIGTEGGQKTPCLPYKPEIHKAIEPSEAERIFNHYNLQNLLDQKRKRMGIDSQVPVFEVIRLTNIPVYSQGTVFGRAEQYFMNLDSGMVMMVLINLTQHGKPTENFILLPFPLLKLDSTRFAYTLRVSEESLSNSPHFSYFAELYYPMEKVSDIYRKFGLINLLDQ